MGQACNRLRYSGILFVHTRWPRFRSFVLLVLVTRSVLYIRQDFFPCPDRRTVRECIFVFQFLERPREKPFIGLEWSASVAELATQP